MSARRTEIRNAFAGAITGLPTTAGRVFVSRSVPLRDNDLPAILVYSGRADPEGSFTANGRPVAMRWRLRADVVVKESVTAEATADQVIDEIRGALFASPGAKPLGGLVQSLSLETIEEAELDDSLEKLVVRVPVVFELVYSPT